MGARGGSIVVPHQAAVVPAGANRVRLFREKRRAEVVALHSVKTSAEVVGFDGPGGAWVVPCYRDLREVAPEEAPRQPVQLVHGVRL